MSKKQIQHKINQDVRFPEVRVIETNGSKLMSSFEAFKLAQSQEKDLILINEFANPPIVKIEEYNKFIYHLQKTKKESAKNSKKSELKEIQLSPTIEINDIQVKLKKSIEFLKEGNKVKVSLILKGRQKAYPEKGQIVMLKFAELISEYGLPENLPKLEGNKWLMILKQKKLSLK